MRCVSVAIAVSVAGSAWAVPLELTHQGRVLDSSGDPLNAEIILGVSLYDASTNGTERWSQDFTLTPEDGYYSVVLGGPSQPLTLSDIDDPAWLAVSIDGVPFGARERLVAVPTAMDAAHADVADNALAWGGVPIDTSSCTDGDALRFSSATGGFVCEPWLTSGSVVNVTTLVSSTRRVMPVGSVQTMETFTVDKKSPTSYLLIQGTLSGWGNHSGSITQGWRYGTGTEVVAQGVMYDNTPHGKVYPTTARITGHTTTGPQSLAFRYYDRVNNGGEAPFLTYNPNASDDDRLNQTSSVYVVWEIEP